MLCANLGGRRQARSVAPKNKKMGQARWGKSQIPHRARLRALFISTYLSYESWLRSCCCCTLGPPSPGRWCLRASSCVHCFSLCALSLSRSLLLLLLQGSELQGANFFSSFSCSLNAFAEKGLSFCFLARCVLRLSDLVPNTVMCFKRFLCKQNPRVLSSDLISSVTRRAGRVKRSCYFQRLTQRSSARPRIRGVRNSVTRYFFDPFRHPRIQRVSIPVPYAPP
jgi:hypothetical protein